jgi:hypothetical protein
VVVAFCCGDDDWFTGVGQVKRSGEERNYGLDRPGRGVFVAYAVVAFLPSPPEVGVGGGNDIEQDDVEGDTLCEEIAHEVECAARVPFEEQCRHCKANRSNLGWV